MQAIQRHDREKTRDFAANIGVGPFDRAQWLLNKAEDLRQAREQVHRFWKNNQPSVLTYDRLNGAIGPQKDEEAPDRP
ncbi:MAG TPA: hypothetical protein VHR66_10245 [Gemmataceae bacterium]|jgi:hypothetical protein|nr:hypothetical protein [Gemmataceae bacterium]